MPKKFFCCKSTQLKVLLVVNNFTMMSFPMVTAISLSSGGLSVVLEYHNLYTTECWFLDGGCVHKNASKVYHFFPNTYFA